MGKNLSEKAKLAYLQEKIKEAKGLERGGLLICVLGVVLAIAGFGFGSFFEQGAATLAEVGGILLAGFGFVWYFYYSNQYFKLLEQLKRMAVANPKCSTRGKELPQGNYAYCPFCGNSLKP